MAVKTVRTAVAVVFLICLAVSVLTFVLAPGIIAIFTDDASVARVAIIALKIMVFAYLLHSIRATLSSAFTGSGNTLPPTVIAISTEALRLGLIAAFIYIFSANESSIWWAFVIASLSDALLLAIWYRKGRWLERCV